MYFVVTYILLMGIWVSFSGILDVFHITLGVISCAFVSYLSTHLLFPKPRVSVSQLLGRAMRFTGYLFWLVKEIILANFHVFYLAMVPGGMKHLEPELVKIKVKLKTEEARYLLANSITLTPGTVSVKLKKDELLVHSISRKTTLSLEGDMEIRIAKIFDENIATT